VGGDIVRLLDSVHHSEANSEATVDPEQRPHDARWVLVRRPTIVVGGELDLDSFDIAANRVTGINEAPLQLKANCGTLVIDDFGRNRFRPTELLNRLVVPMERGIDYFHLSSGRTFQVPFDSMLVFASNEVPAEIVDEAFLRRVPFKIAVHDPEERQFHELYHREAARLHLLTSEDDFNYLLQRHYRETGQSMRFCHPRDLLQMIANACQFHGRSLHVTREAIDRAVEQYVSLRTGGR
jgi:predicted ATPase with chaperone activity